MKTIVTIKFGAHRIPGGVDAILGPTQCGPDVFKVTEYTIDTYFEHRTCINVELTLDATDERLPKVLALLAPHGEDNWVRREDVYTENELQAAPLLLVIPWGHRLVAGGMSYGTTYDVSNACQTCGTGARQTSPLIIDGEDLRTIEKLRIVGTHRGDILLYDVDVEQLIAAQVTGASFWPAQAKTKAGDLMDLRREQMIVEHVLPPLAPSSLLDRTAECLTCHRGGTHPVYGQPLRYVYRAEDLVGMKDVNVTWEWFGNYARSSEQALAGLWPDPTVLITPKVMNLLRSTKKKDAKYQGAYFIPIWIEDGEPHPPRPAM